ncbi:hypothetical protein LZZ85_03905 [Terrimonas sp. NA20]|uniref:Uncharacterized protein n=1 Tax=Terrimonas ginsenosidimutans TaxID=2908004 RepID=A0ABS9KM74_9BACT|nr:hypothetical protein [Terrimonas ginsenosidimutans]MCG2613406.1 hypothetical protein [Terrimonas ginsenosidimutans]
MKKLKQLGSPLSKAAQRQITGGFTDGSCSTICTDGSNIGLACSGPCECIANVRCTCNDNGYANHKYCPGVGEPQVPNP